MLFDRILKGKGLMIDSVSEVGLDGKDTTAELHYELAQGEDSPEVKEDFIALAQSLGFTEEEAKKFFG